VENTVNFKGKAKRRNEDVKFSFNGVGAIEVELKVGKEQQQLFLKPAFKFGNPSVCSLVGIVPFGGAGLGAKIVLGFLDFGWLFLEGKEALFTLNNDRRATMFGLAFSGTEFSSVTLIAGKDCLNFALFAEED
jgi:hypothetical protein